ncbi:MAG: peptidoglycan-binding protein, partial [Gammaproteobacteria bacterium]|nr:peptidoglycan-binding protein [Gammaproteobacteria bacterium]
MFLRRAAALLLLLPVLPLKAETLADYVRQDLQTPAAFTQLACGEQLYAQAALANIYAARKDLPGWVDDRDALPAAVKMLDAIRESRDDGLQPPDYHFHAINHLLDSLHAQDLSADQRRRRLAALEVMLSDAFITLAGNDRYGRVDPEKLNPPAGGVRRGDLGPNLQAALNGVDPQTLIQSFLPQTPEYAAMRAALAHYRALRAGGGIPAIAPGAALRDGDQGERVAALIAHLVAEGDLPAVASKGTRFDSHVQFALKQYQARHGLNSDGIAGAKTLELLNRPAADWINLLRVNLDRLRRLPRNPPATRLVVNIADFHAVLLVHGRIKLAAKVIVGQPGKQTPEFNDWIRYLVVNPAWDVPPSIAGEELL